MNFIYDASTDIVSTYLTHTLKTHLSKGESVLWLLSGGSAIATAHSVAQNLQSIDVSKLAVTLVDERYGPIGHTDENWQQLLDAGFKLNGAHLYRPLRGTDIDQTTQEFGHWIQEQTTTADFSIALLGIGTDGHTAGIKPQTPSVHAIGWATAFTGADFERITITFDTIRHLDEIVVQAMGPDKLPVIRQLQTQDIATDVQPAQILKTVHKSVLYTDNKEILS